MCDSPEGNILGSPEIFSSNIRCNLDSKLMELDTNKSNNLCVYARIRPLLPHEETKGYKVCVAAIDERTVRVLVPTTSAKYKSSRQNEDIIEDYSFTAAFDAETGQFVFFQETMLNIMSNFIEGSNSLIFSYGITGSGKTYTLQGNSENPGIIPLSLKLFFAVTEKQLMKNIKLKPHMYSDVIVLSDSDIQKEIITKEQLLASYDDECESAPGSFRHNNEKSFAMMLCNLFSEDFEAEERQTTLSTEDMASAQAATFLKEEIQKCANSQPGSCCVWVSFIEIYNEVIYDLLQPVSNHRSKLNLGEDKSGNVYIKGATEVCVFNSEEALKILNIGRKHLSIASTKMNYQSSRSHCIYTIRVVRCPDVSNVNSARVCRLSFCDLAGSERTSKTQTTGIRLKEASAINTSLLVLGRCLEHLRLSQMGRDKRLIPFRESKLTRLFSGFFLGQGKAAMIANASPSDYTFDETLHVLKFSAIARKILMNDTFLSNASSTIHSICNQWGMYNNTEMSRCNESMESIESSDSLIREKDELIEKLMNLAKNFAEKEKEMNEMEIHIRRQVCEEYAELREELLEMQKIRYEEEIASLKAIYENKLTNMKKRYDDIIKGFQDQLSDSATDESFLNDQSLNDSKTHEALNDSGMLPLSKPDSSQLKKDLEEKTAELESFRKQLENKQSELNNLRNEYEELTLKVVKIESDKENLQKDLNSEFQKNGCLKDSAESLEKEIKNLQTLKALDEEKINSYQTEIDNLKKSIEMDRKEYEISKNKIQATVEDNLMQEIKKLTEKIDALEKDKVILNEEKSSYENNIKTLEKEVSDKQDNYRKSEKIIQDQCETISTLENETEILRKEIETLEKRFSEMKESKESCETELEKVTLRYKKEISEAKKALNEYSNFQVLYKSDMEKETKKIGALEQELQSANKTTETLQKELKLKETVSMKLEKEIDELKQTIVNLKNEIQESKLTNLELEKKVSTLNEELKLSFEKSQQLSSKLKEVESKNVAYELEIEKLLKNKENMVDSSKVISLEKELSCVQSELLTLKEENKRISINLNQLENDEKKLKIDGENYKNLEENCKSLKELNESIKLEKANLEKKLLSTENDIENIRKTNLENLQSKEEENKRLSTKYEQDLEMWKKEKVSFDSENKDLKEKLTRATDNIKSLKKDIEIKAAKVAELENSCKNYDMDNEKLKQNQLLFDSQKKELEGKLTLATNNMKSIQQDIQEQSSKISELENQINAYKKDIANLKDDNESLESDNLELKSEIDSCKEKIKDLEENLTSTMKNLENALGANQKSIENEMNDDKQEINKLKESLQLTQKEKNDLLVKITEKTKRISDIEAELSSTAELLEFERKSAGEKDIQLNNFKNELTQLKNEVKEKETKLDLITKKLKEIEMEFNTLKEKNEKLSIKVIDVESEKKLLEKKIAENKDLGLSNTQLQEKISELTSKIKVLDRTESEFKTMKKDYDQLENAFKAISSEKENLLKSLESEKQNLALSNTQLQEKIAELASKVKILDRTESEFKTMKKDYDQLENAFKALTSEKQNLALSNTQLQEKIAELASKDKTESEFKTMKKDYDQLKNAFKAVSSEKENLLKSLESEKQNLALLNTQLQEKIAELASKVKILDRTESEFKTMKKDYDELENTFKAVSSEKENLLKSLESEKQNLAQLKKDLKEKETKLESVTKELKKIEKDMNILKEKNEKLGIKIVDIESEKKSLEKQIAINEDILQEKLMKSKNSYETKLLMENEQHTVEIEETMKLKREAEKENEKLKEKIKLLEEEMKSAEQNKQPENNKQENLPRNKLPDKNKKETLVRTTSKTEPKESGKSLKVVKKSEVKETGLKSRIAKTSSTRSLRHKEVPLLDISFSSTETVESENPELKKTRKRTSDQDFNPAKERPLKKMKSSAEGSKIPGIKGTSKRKLQNDQVDNLSPVQKFANSITTRFKSVADSVSSKIASPRVTRGRKKLYDPELGAPSKSEKVTRRKQ